MTKTFLFYDLETSGLSACFDQVLQFAAIRTDLNLRELERYEFLVKLNVDIIPSPGAVITHRLGVQHTATGIKEIDAIRKIHALLNTPGTISLGYNTLNFDDEFLRFSFYRNLLPAYTHQYANQCSRADLYPMAILFYLYKRECLQWPQINGKISLKLEFLNQANQLATGMAHNAMCDVEASVALARIFQQHTDMWNYALSYFDKQVDLKRLNNLDSYTIAQENYKLALLIDGQLGTENHFQCPVLCLGTHHHYKNQMLCLRLDREELASTQLNTLGKTSWVIAKKAGDLGLILPLTPHYSRHLNPERIKILENNKRWLQMNEVLFKQIVNHHKEYKYPKIPRLDADASLYEIGFLTPEQEHLCRLFHNTEPQQKAAIATQFNYNELRALAIRILGRHYPNFMTENFSTEFEDYLQTIKSDKIENALVDYRGGKRLTSKVALAEIDQLLASGKLDTEQAHLLKELADYIKVYFTYNLSEAYESLPS